MILLCTGAALLAAGCGSGGGSGHRLSETGFRSQANHICSELTRQAKAGSSSESGVQQSFARVDAAVGRLEGLDPPAKDAPQYHELLTNFKQGVAFLKANRQHVIQMLKRLSANPSDRTLLSRYRRLIRPFEEEIQRAATDATALGLTDCASGFSGGSAASGQPTP